MPCLPKVGGNRSFRATVSEETMAGARALIVDDSTTLRRYIVDLLVSAPGVHVIGEAASGSEALTMARELNPDLVLMDVRMPGTNGLETTVQLKREMPHVQVIILTTYDLPEYREAARMSGASGYVVKRALPEALLPAIQEVCARQSVIVAS
jgi:DNA-binding NarL/FixJ family response regulator